MAKATPGPLLTQIRGRIGNEVAIKGRNGLVLRGRPTYKRPTQLIQQTVQNRMTQVMAAYNTLTREQAMQWNAYASTLTRSGDTDNAPTHPTGQNVYVGLASKFLQVNPTGTVPLAPPTSPYFGDTLTVTLSGGTGQLLFTASAANAPDTRTELLVQKLKTPRRSPVPFYKSTAFVAFTPAVLTYALPSAPGWYACACRFVNSATGQMTTQVAIGIVEVT